MEHFYQHIHGFMNHRNTIMLDKVLDVFPPGGTWVELGTWTGRSAAYCIVELIKKQRLGKFFCVDSWSGGTELKDSDLVKNSTIREVFINNMKPVEQHYTMIDLLSWDAATKFADNSVDFCYVDAGHTFEDVTQDLNAWWPKIKPGSFFGGDDFTKGYLGLQKAIDSFFKPKQIPVSKYGRCWLVTKPNDPNNVVA